MLKSKWFFIGISVVAIVAYDYFVVRPYGEKLKKYQESQKKSTEIVASPTGTQNSTNSLNQGPVAESQEKTNSVNLGANGAMSNSMPWNVSENTKGTRLDFSNQRSVTILEDGRIGKAQFNDFFVRGGQLKTPVVITEFGYRWSSTDSDVQNCLQNLVSTADSQSLTLTGKTDRGTCAIKYALDSKISGHVVSSLELNGFTNSKGDLFVSTLGEPSTGLTQDHHFLSTSINGSVSHIKDKDLFKESKFDGQVAWALWGDRYFASTLLPTGKWNPTVFHKQKDLGDKKLVEFGFRYPIALENTRAVYEVDYYFSTRDGEVLDLVRPGLSQAVELGFFGMIANILLMCLRGINVVFNNFGWSIVVLTLLVRILFWPLNKKVFASSQRMKDIQPEVEKIKNKYGNDKSKATEMQAEIWAMYKKNNVNPVGSCLPLLLQMPIFFALYGALNHSIDLYQAPFFGWISDLSSPDPFYIFPVLWTLSLLAYLKINPQQPTQPGAPDMKWIMIAMNIFIGYLSKDWPSGLTLYLFVSNLVGILQQFVMLRGGKKLQTVQEGV
jgi:YidC/Oxa1 family membrane protein insertase